MPDGMPSGQIMMIAGVEASRCSGVSPNRVIAMAAGETRTRSLRADEPCEHPDGLRLARELRCRRGATSGRSVRSTTK